MGLFIPPMLLATTAEPFDDERYIFQPKIDGHRTIIVRHNLDTRIFTRNGNDVTRLYPELCDLPICDDVVLDGEIACHDETGNVDFELIQKRFAVKKSDKIQAAMAKYPVTFYSWDILSLNGRDLRNLPLTDRQRILANVYGESPNYRSILTVDGVGKALFNVIKARRMEGIVAKRKDSKYVSQRHPAWQKIINWMYEDVFITGWRKGVFGWLAAVSEGNGELRTVGTIELGITPAARQAFQAVMHSLVIGEDRNNVYVEPKIRARVKLRNWFRTGIMRSPSFVKFIL